MPDRALMDYDQFELDVVIIGRLSRCEFHVVSSRFYFLQLD